WRVVLRHGTHTHPLTTRTGETASFTAGDDHDADSNYEITLIASDSRGLSSQKTVIINPKTVQYTLDSDPAGVNVSYGGISAKTPMTRTSAVGYRTTISANQTVEVNGRTLSFDRWSDGGAWSHDVVIPDTDATVKAFYVEVEDKALGMPATASSVEKAGLEAGKANDGDSSTRWSSAFADNQWWQVDLGTTRDVSAVELNWETAYARTYKIQTSTDGATFTDVASVTLDSAKVERTTFPTVSARYVRVMGLTRATEFGFSFWDAKVFGPTDTTTPDSEEKALGMPATASSVEAAGLEAGKANDGDSSTRWSSQWADNQWWQVDLGTTRDINAVELNWEYAHARTYKIQTSTDGATFTDVASVTLDSAKLERTTFPTVSARYVRVLGLTRATEFGFSFWDARVFGPTETTTPDPPPPAASYTFSPTSPEVGQAVSFDGSGSGCAATPCSYRWEDGTQAIGTGATLTHSFSTAGEHPVKLTVTDAQSRSDSTTKTITVSEPPAEEPEDKALKKPASASSVFSKGYTPDKGNDGDSSTRWMSARKDNEWWQVDLGAARKIDTVELNWSEDYARTYKIQVSTDGTTFTDVASVTLSVAALQRSTFPTIGARYVRILGLTRATRKGFSFWDARVFGPADA
ncbi:MAG: discoidin domain-containing protein, partial [Actinomycetota bacterium]|nr:discoidin domain-containing protein [Actinomycetota bacterium]